MDPLLKVKIVSFSGATRIKSMGHFTRQQHLCESENQINRVPPNNPRSLYVHLSILKVWGKDK